MRERGFPKTSYRQEKTEDSSSARLALPGPRLELSLGLGSLPMGPGQAPPERAAWAAAWMRMATSKSEARVDNWKQAGGEFLPPVSPGRSLESLKGPAELAQDKVSLLVSM